MTSSLQASSRSSGEAESWSFFTKGKGSAADVDNYMGMLVSDHLSKVLTAFLQRHLNDVYLRVIGEAQFGAVCSPWDGTGFLDGQIVHAYVHGQEMFMFRPFH